MTDNGEVAVALPLHQGSGRLPLSHTLSNTLSGTLICLYSSSIAVVSLFYGLFACLLFLQILRDFYVNSVLGF